MKISEIISLSIPMGLFVWILILFLIDKKQNHQ